MRPRDLPLVHPGSPQAVHAVWGVFSSFTGQGMVATCWGQGCKFSVLPEIRWEIPCRHSGCRSRKGVGGFFVVFQTPVNTVPSKQSRSPPVKSIRLPSDRKIVTHRICSEPLPGEHNVRLLQAREEEIRRAMHAGRRDQAHAILEPVEVEAGGEEPTVPVSGTQACGRGRGWRLQRRRAKRSVTRASGLPGEVCDAE